MQPIIGITAGFNNNEEKHFITDYYVKAIESLGGIPILLPSVGINLVEALYEQVDGIIFSGGGDVDPGYFGQSPLRGIGEITPLRDRFELYLAKKALNGKKPVLGICRGMQILNIAAGGNIYQDIEHITKIEHDQKAPKWAPYHEIEVANNSLLLDIIGKNKIKVNSFHHQAVKDIGAGLIKSAWTEDGIVEAVESVNRERMIIGVQWHPECCWDRDKNAKALFEYLVGNAKK
ncbi:MAG: gamma-glutamyl-gamma-aminobutyrate hydrolase family protein [Bacillota bacterium]